MLLADHALAEQQHGNMDYCDTENAEGGENGENRLGSKKKSSHTCKICHKTFDCLSYLKQHMRVHTALERSHSHAQLVVKLSMIGLP